MMDSSVFYPATMPQYSPSALCDNVVQAIDRAPHGLASLSCRRTMIEFALTLRQIFALPIQRNLANQEERVATLKLMLEESNKLLSDLIYMDDESIPDLAVYNIVKLSKLASAKAKQLLKDLRIQEVHLRGSAANLRTKAPILLRRFERL
jgi:hypothetical protein